MDIRYIQALLGHVKLETTSLSAQVSIRELKRLHSALHPAARLERAPTVPGSREVIPAASDLLNQLEEEAEEEGADL